MPEGDTLFRTAAGLRPYLVGRAVTAARARAGPGAVPQVQRLVGQRIDAVESLGKNLLIRFDGGLELRTHLRMNGSWHRYRPGERWRRPPGRARLVLEVPGSVAVCFDAPVVELFEQRAADLHPLLSKLGPDLLDLDADLAEARHRLRAPERASVEIAVALLDQRALAGIGNVYKNEVLWIERVSPFSPVGDLDDATLDRLIGTARRLLRANADANGGRGPERVTTAGDRSAPGASSVRSRWTAVPPLPYADQRHPAGHGPAAHDLLVLHLSGRTAIARIEVTCVPTAAGWQCEALVDDGDTSGRHVVTVAAEDADRLAAAHGSRPGRSAWSMRPSPSCWSAKIARIDPAHLRPDGREPLPRVGRRDRPSPRTLNDAPRIVAAHVRAVRRARRGALSARRAVAVRRAAGAVRDRGLRLGRGLGPPTGGSARIATSAPSATTRGRERGRGGGRPRVLVHLRRPSRLSTLQQPDTQPFADPAGRFGFSHNGDLRDFRRPGPRYRRQAGSTGAPTPRSASAGSRMRGRDEEPVGHLLGALHDAFGGEANLAVIARTARPTTTPATRRTRCSRFRLGRIGRGLDGDLLGGPLAVPLRRAGRNGAAPGRRLHTTIALDQSRNVGSRRRNAKVRPSIACQGIRR